jgi:hypothetical protein
MPLDSIFEGQNPKTIQEFTELQARAKKVARFYEDRIEAGNYDFGFHDESFMHCSAYERDTSYLFETWETLKFLTKQVNQSVYSL